MKYQIIKEREATYKEVFDNLKHGGLKLLFENLKTKKTVEAKFVINSSFVLSYLY